MAEYAIVDNDEIVGFRHLEGDPPVLLGKSYRKFLPVEVTKPTFDEATQVRSGPVVTLLEDKVTRVWTVRDKTQAELDEDAEARIDRVDVLAFKVLFNHENRVRALEGKQAVTAAQFRNALKAML